MVVALCFVHAALALVPSTAMPRVAETACSRPFAPCTRPSVAGNLRIVHRDAAAAPLVRRRCRASDVQMKAPPSSLTTVVIILAFMWKAWSSTQREDREESVRVKKESEKMEQLGQEYMDIDEGVVSDEDLFGSLAKRMAEVKDAEGEGGDGAADAGDDGEPPLAAA